MTRSTIGGRRTTIHIGGRHGITITTTVIIRTIITTITITIITIMTISIITAVRTVEEALHRRRPRTDAWTVSMWQAVPVRRL